MYSSLHCFAPITVPLPFPWLTRNSGKKAKQQTKTCLELVPSSVPLCMSFDFRHRSPQRRAVTELCWRGGDVPVRCSATSSFSWLKKSSSCARRCSLMQELALLDSSRASPFDHALHTTTHPCAQSRLLWRHKKLKWQLH